MESAALDANLDDRGSALLLEHCTALAELDHPRPTPSDRLSGMVGGELAKFLLAALRRVRDRQGL
jgi:hypothetical protein